ncbi:BTAD domain-containing putative transcriptional regulator [Streptomyces sp.]|uniref:BTAD domain-containing putative transcriptional regulator n=1 Tax=Streptomyces sp. TaxID=1931 RepID=UPI002D774165|nr:BTAD domain-containing putative transcriptional regulator [Streptomyces sp.]HET6355946.1 BTAD domain-containing putative transcriptional regulator [Streptomyces sp.]
MTITPAEESDRAVGSSWEDWTVSPGLLRQAASRTDLMEPALGQRLGMTYQLMGEPARALDVHRRTALAGAGTPDEIKALAWAAAAHCARGRLRPARALGQLALRALRHCCDPRAQAVTHATAGTIAALEGHGSLAEHHADRAREATRYSGDAMLHLFVHTSLAAERLEHGACRDVCDTLGTALRALGGDHDGVDVPLVLLARCRRGAAHLALGELDRAIADFTSALDGYQRLSESLESGPLGSAALVGLGDAHRERGDLGEARAAYQEAVVRTERSGDAQLLASALTGLALTRCTDAPGTAAVLARRAADGCVGPQRIRALVAGGWIALADNRPETAAEAARQAAGERGAQISRTVCAEILELEAMCLADGRARQRLLDDAEALWATAQRPLAVARVAVARARLRHAPAPLREETLWLRQFGVSPAVAEAAGLLNRVMADREPCVSVRVLGGFRVIRDGVPVGADEWQSKKARDLLKVLVGRRGLPTSREVLIDTLWPDEDPARCANRLSVALSTVRIVLDPGRRMPQDHFITADKHVVGLARLRVDVQEFLTAARHAISGAQRTGGGAFASLAAAEELYRGDVLEDEPYAPWAAGLREEAQAVYLELLTQLAAATAENDDRHAEAHYRLRLLERDPYDEDAHLGLVSLLTTTGRHGEARRRYLLYTAAMNEIEVTPAAFPSARRGTAAGAGRGW